MEWLEDEKNQVLSCMGNMTTFAGRFYNCKNPDRWTGILQISIENESKTFDIKENTKEELQKKIKSVIQEQSNFLKKCL